MPALHAEPQEVPLELAGDEAVGGADEVQHLDDIAVGGHGALGGGDDDGGGGGADQQQDGEAAQREGARDGADLLLPAAVIVERHALELLRPARRAARRGRAACCGRARRRSASAPAARCSASVWPSHGSSSWDASATLSARTLAMPGWRDRKRGDVGHRLVDVGALLGLDLHRDLAGDVAQPGGGRLVHHVDRAGRQAGEKAHDGDDERQRAAGDRAGRHDRRGRLRSDRCAASGCGRVRASAVRACGRSRRAGA